MRKYVRLGDLVVPPKTLQLISPQSSGIVVFSGAVLQGEPSEWLQQLQQMEGSTVRLQWRDGPRERSDIVRVEQVRVEEKTRDGALITHYSCRVQIVG
ncbi:MAG: hypothetical protein N2320_00095 [Candidatus Bipolaricaulota bacterium]|nr:hypothetical protein [Candidatus Bipolaricaulota bacterium]